MQPRPHHPSPAACGSRGVSLIELLVGIAILGIAVAIGAPSFAEWINNSQIRSTAESIQNGLQFARSEAVRRNQVVRMQLTTTADNGCAISKNGTNWAVTLGAAATPASHCGDKVDETAAPAYLLQKGTSVSSKASATVSTQQEGVVAFNGLGRVIETTSPATSIGTWSIDIQSSRGTCVADPGGTLRCLRVVVTPGGQIRMCDPKRGAGDPMACP